jgi:hypothetical protein
MREVATCVPGQVRKHSTSSLNDLRRYDGRQQHRTQTHLCESDDETFVSAKEQPCRTGRQRRIDIPSVYVSTCTFARPALCSSSLLNGYAKVCVDVRVACERACTRVIRILTSPPWSYRPPEIVKERTCDQLKACVDEGFSIPVAIVDAEPEPERTSQIRRAHVQRSCRAQVMFILRILCIYTVNDAVHWRRYSVRHTLTRTLSSSR